MSGSVKRRKNDQVIATLNPSKCLREPARYRSVEIRGVTVQPGRLYGLTHPKGLDANVARL